MINLCNVLYRCRWAIGNKDDDTTLFGAGGGKIGVENEDEIENKNGCGLIGLDGGLTGLDMVVNVWIYPLKNFKYLSSKGL